MDSLADELYLAGRRAYMQSDYGGAVELFTSALDLNVNHWLCRLYRAMSNFRLGKPEMSACDLSLILNCCPDRDLRSKAQAGLKKVEFACSAEHPDLGSLHHTVAAS